MPSNTVDKLVDELSRRIEALLGQSLVGIYLFGSLSYGDFNPETSDVDLMVVVKQQLSKSILSEVDQLHQQIGAKYPKWKTRIEISYTPEYFLKSDSPPSEPRPYLGESVFYPKAPYGNEWIINLYLLYEHGVALYGPAFSSLRPRVEIALVQDACRKDLIQEWLPKLNDEQWLSNPHYQSYLVLNLCRIVNTLETATALSKKRSALYIKERYPQWRQLIEAAEDWTYEKPFPFQTETKQFLTFVLNASGVL